jgi:hypothetical protein
MGPNLAYINSPFITIRSTFLPTDQSFVVDKLSSNDSESKERPQFLPEVCSGVIRQYRWSYSLYISLRRWNRLFRFPRRPWLFLLVYLVVLWKCEGINWSFSATRTSRLVRRKLQVCANSLEGSANAYWVSLLFWNAAALVRLDVRTAMAATFILGAIHNDTSQKTIIRNCCTVSCLNRNRRPFLVWLVVVSVVCCFHRFIVKLGVRVRLRGQSKLILQHLLVSENLGEEMDQTVVERNVSDSH